MTDSRPPSPFAELDRVNDLYSACLRGNEQLRAENERLRDELNSAMNELDEWTSNYTQFWRQRAALNPPGTAAHREGAGHHETLGTSAMSTPAGSGPQPVPSDTEHTSHDLRTSQQWLNLYQAEHPGFLIYDPDGWDRGSYEASWNERITQGEFDRRVIRSTCRWPQSMLAKPAPIRGETDPAPTCPNPAPTCPNCRTPMVWDDENPGGSFWLCRQCNEADWWTSNPAAAPTQAATTGVGALEELIALLSLSGPDWEWELPDDATAFQALHDALQRKLSPAADRGLLLLVRAMREGR
jgi:hypothetical protein